MSQSVDDAQRLSKVVAAQVPCSRSEAEQYITEGWVRVDGHCVDTPQVRVSAGQRVEVDPQARLQHQHLFERWQLDEHRRAVDRQDSHRHA